MDNTAALQLISAREQALHETITAARKELASLSATKAILQGKVSTVSTAAGTLTVAANSNATITGSLPVGDSARTRYVELRPGEKPPKQADMVLAVLRNSAETWLDQAQIGQILAANGTPIVPGSLQPVLSKLRRENKVARKGNLVAHPDRAAVDGIA